MEYTERKKLRWEHWNYNNSGAYFLTICTKDREKILSRIQSDPAGEYLYDSDERRLSVVLTDFGKIAEKYLGEASRAKGISVEHYVIMPDHIHIILAVEGDLITEKESGKEIHERVPKFLSTFKTLCHKEAGQKFLQRSAFDHVIRNHQDYEATVHYMYSNPGRWYHRERYGEERRGERGTPWTSSPTNPRRRQIKQSCTQRERRKTVFYRACCGRKRHIFHPS